MKTLRFILMAAAAMLVVATCDDDSMNMDKTRISANVEFDSLYVYPTPTTYVLQWSQPKYKTDHGSTVLSDGSNNVQIEYEVWLKKENGDDVLNTKLNTKVETGVSEKTGEIYNYTTVTIEELKGQGLLENNTNNFQFGIKPANMSVDDGKNENKGVFYQTVHTVIVAVDSSIKAEKIISCSWGKIEPSEQVFPADNADNHNYYSFAFDAGNDNNRWENINITLKASVPLGYKFERWSDGSTENPRDLTVNGNVWLEAIYSKLNEQKEGGSIVTVNVEPEGFGKVIIGGGEIITIDGGITRKEIESRGEIKYGEKEIVALTANAANKSYYFDCWTDANGNTVSADNTYSFTAQGDVTLTAKFGEKTDMPKEYPGMNTWYILNCKENTGGTVIGRKAMSIVIDGTQSDDDENWDVWSENICCVFQFNDQNFGDKFHLEFDINWKGENSSKDKVGISLLSGGYRSIDEERELGDIDELKFPDNSKMQAFVIPLNEEGEGNKRITWEGTIGKEGAIDENPEAYISVTIHLAGLYGNPSIPNGPGTFTISNMKVSIDGNEKW